MSELKQGLLRLLEMIPLILLITLIEMGICFAVAGIVLLELMKGVGRQYPYIALVIAIVVAIFVQGWLLFNHRLRAYINTRNNQ